MTGIGAISMPVVPMPGLSAGGTDRAHEAAVQLVSSAFVQPILAELRETSRASGVFAPTSAEKRFGPMLDALIADNLTKAANFPLVDAVKAHMSGARNAGGVIYA